MPSPLTPDLRAVQEEIEGYARAFGLDPFPTIFELLEHDELNEVASYGGFPVRYPHWRHGMIYEHMSKGYEYGLQKIYELVINSKPCYAYLMKSNSMVDQKTVIAHVMGHSDFFKNNDWFSKTNRNMINEMANHGTRIRRYVDRYGLDEVESFVDACLSLDNLIDPFLPFEKPRAPKPRDTGAIEPEDFQVWRIQTKSYMDQFVNPPEFIEAQRKKIAERKKEKKKVAPAQSRKDVLLFLMEHAPLERWERDVLAIVRDEAYYFAPQAQTKIMNEGWAAYWHSRIMTEKVLRDSEVVDFADHHSGTLARSPGSLNPYKLGIELFRKIEERWNKGRFGLDFERCDDMDRRNAWDLKLMQGQQKIFQVRKHYNDMTFIDEFVDEEFVEEQNLYSYKYNQQTGRYEIESRDWRLVKEKILFGLTNLGHPYISAEDGNFMNKGELYLKHRHDGIDLQMDKAQDTLRNLLRIWHRPVHIETLVEGEGKVLSYDGEEYSQSEFKSG